MIKELTGKHVLFILIAFFGTIFFVNGILIYLSQSSWTGLETHDAYRQGLKYNQTLSKSEAQNMLGWTMDISHEIRSNGSFALTAIPKDNNGEGLSRLKITAKLKRPTHEGVDRDFSLNETGLGIYTGEIKELHLGKWYLLIAAGKKDEILYRSKNALYLK